MTTILLKPTDLHRIAEEREAERQRQAQELERKRQEHLKDLHDAFMHRHLQPGAEEHFNRLVREAVERGEHEIQLLRFPSDWCTDRGRAINNQLDEWPDTLTGFARELYDSFEQRLQPLGYKLRVQILDYPDGMPGDVGMFLSW